MSFKTNRRTLKPFPVTRKRGPTLEQLVADLKFQGRYADQIRFLREHGFANYDDRVTPDGYIHERWMNNFGDLVILKISRPSDVRMEDATVVNADFIPASKNVSAPKKSEYEGPLGEDTREYVPSDPRYHDEFELRDPEDYPGYKTQEEVDRARGADIRHPEDMPGSINPQEMFARMEEVRGGYAVIYNPKTGRHRVARHPEGEMSYEEAVAEAKERRKNAR